MILRRRRHRRRSGQARIAALDIERADTVLLDVLDADFAEAKRRAGPWLACRPGCSECCFGPFPITRLDVRRLRRGIGQLSATKPERAKAVRRRAERCTQRLADGFPGDLASGRLTQDETRLDPFFERHSALACPALDAESGTCELYRWRPVSCRTYGPPMRFAEEKSPPCDLCFRGASPATVESCRIEPHADGIEGSILARMGVSEDEDWETLIAFALSAD